MFCKYDFGALKHLEAVVWRCFLKKLFLEVSKNSQKTPVPESLYYKRDCRTGGFL